MADLPRAKQAVCNRLIYHHSFMSGYWLRNRDIINPFNVEIMKTEIQLWHDECVKFQTWFKNAGGNIASNEQMSEAFTRIEAKNISDNSLYALLDEQEAVLKLPEYENWVKSIERISGHGTTYFQDYDND